MLSQRLSSKPSTFSRVRTSSDYCRKTESGKRPLSTRTSNPSYNWVLGSRTCWYLRVFAKHWNKWPKTKSLWTRSERIFRLLTKTNSTTSMRTEASMLASRELPTSMITNLRHKIRRRMVPEGSTATSRSKTSRTTTATTKSSDIPFAAFHRTQNSNQVYYLSQCWKKSKELFGH